MSKLLLTDRQVKRLKEARISLERMDKQTNQYHQLQIIAQDMILNNWNLGVVARAATYWQVKMPKSGLKRISYTIAKKYHLFLIYRDAIQHGKDSRWYKSMEVNYANPYLALNMLDGVEDPDHLVDVAIGIKKVQSRYSWGFVQRIGTDAKIFGMVMLVIFLLIVLGFTVFDFKQRKSPFAVAFAVLVIYWIHRIIKKIRKMDVQYPW